jgi:SAM-dependent methyltransferase
MRLTDREYWERVHAAPEAAAPHRRGGLLHWLGSLAWTRPYDDFLLWEVVLPEYLGDARGRKAVEIGSAPGHFMVKLADAFGIEPFGVEYTTAGARANREVFAAAGYDPAGVIEADVLSAEFQSAHRAAFDVVLSRGFIEHFEDPYPAVQAHLELLKPGGLLIVMVPNLRGVYYPWTWLFNRPQIALHNVNIMRLDAFRGLFERAGVPALHCRHHGTFTFWLFTAEPPAPVMRHVLRVLVVAQRGLNVLFRGLLGRRGFETPWFSPNLLFIGRKPGP